MDEIKNEKLTRNKKIFIIIFIILIIIFNSIIGVIIHTRKDIDKFKSIFEEKTEIISFNDISDYINNDLYTEKYEEYSEESSDIEYTDESSESGY